MAFKVKDTLPIKGLNLEDTYHTLGRGANISIEKIRVPIDEDFEYQYLIRVTLPIYATKLAYDDIEDPIQINTKEYLFDVTTMGANMNILKKLYIELKKDYTTTIDA